MKRFALVPLAIALVLLTVSCDNSKKAASVERQDTTLVGTQQEIYQKGQPLPIFNFSQQRQSLIEINTAIAKGASTYTVFYSFGKPVFVCPSIGYPIPATTQLTNPEQLVKQSDVNSNGGNVTLPQAEPIGTYTGSTAATYVICVRDDGKATAIYSEPDVMAFPFPVKIVDGAVVDAGGSTSFSISTGGK